MKMAICPRCKNIIEQNTASGYCSTCEAALRFTGELPKAVTNAMPPYRTPTPSQETSETGPVNTVKTEKKRSRVITARCIIVSLNGAHIGNLVASALKQLTKMIEDNKNNVINICYGPLINCSVWIEETVSIIYEGPNQLKRYAEVNGNIVNKTLTTDWRWKD